MKRNQFLAFCCFSSASCFLGGFLAQAGPARAMAQYQTYPAGQVNPNQVTIRSENSLFVPEGGLRMVNAQNRTIGVIMEQAGNAGIILFNSQNQPSVTILAGQAGNIDINGSSESLFKATDPSRKHGIVMEVTGAKASLKVRDALEFTGAKDGGRIVVKDAKNTTGVRVDTDSGGGRVTGFDSSQATVFELATSGDVGQISLSQKDKGVGFQATGAGSAQVKRDKETVWKVPADGH